MLHVFIVHACGVYGYDKDQAEPSINATRNIFETQSKQSSKRP